MDRTYLEHFRNSRAAVEDEAKETERSEADRDDARIPIRQLSDGEILQRHEG
jgi:hypothetical protein